MPEIQTGQHWLHKKRGTVYEIVAIDASIQISSMGDDEVQDVIEDAVWIAYRPVSGHALHFRMHDEFMDGRFEFVQERPE